MPLKISKKNLLMIDGIVDHYEANLDQFKRLAESLWVLFSNSRELTPLIHSIKWRVKEPSHLRDKLIRKFKESLKAKAPFDITISNLFEKITDLAGVRLLHLHTTQIDSINQAIKGRLAFERYIIAEGPFARTWDDEYAKFFKSVGITPERKDTFYTSVHYIVQPNHAEPYSAEIQVRTLAEELWGEVSHSINYPHPTTSLACSEQIAVLARVTSSCTRLVDSLYKSLDEHEIISGRKQPPKSKATNKPKAEPKVGKKTTKKVAPPKARKAAGKKKR